MSPDQERDLAVILTRIVNPEHPDFDPEVAGSLMALRPEWFTVGEIARFAEWRRSHPSRH